MLIHEGLFGLTPLIAAVERKDQKSVQLLIDAGADMNSKNPDGNTALIFAAKKGDKESVQILTEAGAKVNSKDGECWTALMHAAMYGKYGMHSGPYK